MLVNTLTQEHKGLGFDPRCRLIDRGIPVSLGTLPSKSSGMLINGLPLDPSVRGMLVTWAWAEF